MPDVIEKKWRRHDNLAVTVNDAAPWSVCPVVKNTKCKQTISVWFDAAAAYQKC